ncbi:hypothetical protein GJU40_10635 [Bacillus lacus]|uniref:DUF5658 domain-containing protein n=1 Tax=Metabacillus lacus TaxID=1983721 RepID=A0A7X2IZE4_9BACI|nr:DUF5658 family protein [Metabacillus lacus]MRX72603.1 hypothetical protein [Metabacillus lacus]
MAYILLYLSLLNAVDGLFTFQGLQSGIIQEANPLMAALYSNSPVAFLTVKLCLSFLLLLLLACSGRLSRSKPAVILSLTACILYTMVLVLHGYWITSIF